MSNSPERRQARRQISQLQGKPMDGIDPRIIAAASKPQAGPVFNVGPLMNGDQLVAFAAANCPGAPAEAVDRGIEIVAEAIARVATGELERRVKAKMALLSNSDA